MQPVAEFLLELRDKAVPTPEELNVHLAEHSGRRRVPGLTNEELAERLGYSADHLKDILQGHQRPSEAFLSRVADEFTLTLRDRAYLWTLAGYEPELAAARTIAVDAWQPMLNDFEPNLALL